MKKFLAVSLYYIYLLRTTSAHRFSCPKNEVLQRCRKPCQPTCQNSYTSSRCSIFVCKPGCVCKSGCMRDEVSGKCIDRQYCPTDCPENEMPSNGGNGCEPTCQNEYSRFECRSQIKRCICKPGLVRDTSSGKCISSEECSKILSCKEYEKWSECSDRNCTETCQRRKPKVCPTTCKPGCSCQDGYLWDEHLQKCVSKWKCSKACRKNEDWCQQLPDYIPTCQSILDPQCLDCNEPSREVSRSGCICIKGFIWDDTSQRCVRLEECTSVSNATVSTTESSSTTSPDSSTSEVSSSSTYVASASTADESSTSTFASSSTTEGTTSSSDGASVSSSFEATSSVSSTATSASSSSSPGTTREDVSSDSSSPSSDSSSSSSVSSSSSSSDSFSPSSDSSSSVASADTTTSTTATSVASSPSSFTPFTFPSIEEVTISPREGIDEQSSPLAAEPEGTP